jgi:uncharacterized protein involved in type VI secretion and phage assembly
VELNMLSETLLALENAVFQKVYGKYAGRVEDVDDKQKIGRIKVSVPDVLRGETKWAMPCVPYAGPQIGHYFIPPVGAGVWVEFEGGDVSRPIWVGCYWGTGQLPPDATAADVHVLATGKTTMKMDDSGSGEVEISNEQKAKTTWAADVATEAGSATHSVGADGVISESAPGKVEIGASGVSVNNGAFTVA